MGGSQRGRCEYEWPTDCERVDTPNDPPERGSCCIREAVEDAERCLWHVPPTETDEKTAQALIDLRESNDSGMQTSGYQELLDGAILEGISLVDAADFERTRLRGANLSGADISDSSLSEADLRDADLSETYLFNANLTKANLLRTDLSGALVHKSDFSGAELTGTDLSGSDLTEVNFSNADLLAVDLSNGLALDSNFSNSKIVGAEFSETTFSGANFTDSEVIDGEFADLALRNVNFSDANLNHADFSNADLQEANLSGADLHEADLSGADLRGADLRGSRLSDVTLDTAALARSTQIGEPGERIIRELANDTLSEEVHDIVARTNHELRTVYSANGLISRARSARARERRARRKEAFAEGGLLSTGTFAWFGSLLSKLFTGYGVQLNWIAAVMAILYLGSALVYNWEGLSVGRSLYYSVVTFTTSPPKPPSEVGFGTIGTLVAGLETFAGTAAIVFLGYVLGTRERV